MARSLFPRTITTPAPTPRIVTVYDTVAKIDTLWKVKVREQVRHDTVFAESVVVSKPDTVRIQDTVYTYDGITFVLAGRDRADSVLVSGFRVRADGTSVVQQSWQTKYWQAGPLKSLDAGVFPPAISFYPEPPKVKPCNTFCKAGYYLVGGLAGFAAGKIF